MALWAIEYKKARLHGRENLKLEQFEKLNEKPIDFNLRVLAREEIELIQKVIDEKRAAKKL